MKKLLMCFFAMLYFAPAAFAADGAVSRVLPTGGTTTSDSAGGASAGRTNVSRAVTKSAATPSSVSDEVSNTVSRSVSRVFLGASDAPAPGVIKARNASGQTGLIGRSVVVSRGGTGTRATLEDTVNTVGRNSRVSSASINSDPSVRRAGVVLRPSTAEVGGRAIIGDTGVQTGSNIDEVVARMQSRKASSEDKPMTAETIAEATQRLEQTAVLNKSCQEQYNECMDQFCSVIDANQGRCSCSSNLAQYAKTEQAVKDANVQLNEVAQLIRYVGLSADEIRAIMSETEAEEALSSTRDNSATRNMLEEIEELIKDPVSSNNSYYSSSSSSDMDWGFGFDTEIDFTADTSDLFSLDFLQGEDNSSFSKLRGTDLYNAAKKRCKVVLNQCADAGATTTQITGNYDLAIDKDCIAYEQGLVKMNENLLANVRSANRMLQKARLAVLQNKNQYDAKGCIAALDTCMKDPMVCGENYYQCIDPTKRYIDENGEVVLGQDISKITEFMKNYNNALIDDVFLEGAVGQPVTPEGCSQTANGSCVARYLMEKIGTGSKITDGGLCRAVLDKCQRYTYDKDANYIPYNDVVVNYVQRALVNVRAAQQKIIAEYASECMLDIATCYNQQVTQVNAWSSSASVSSVLNVMRGACKNVALTCAYAVFDGDATSCPSDNPGQCITSISEIFYQSLLCPENSTYTTQKQNDASQIGNGKSYVNAHCLCNNGYEAWGTACLIKCGEHAYRSTYGTCVCEDSYKMVSGACVKEETPQE